MTTRVKWSCGESAVRAGREVSTGDIEYAGRERP